MNDLRCPACGREAATGVTYPYRCLCGGLWSAAGGAYRDLLAEARRVPTPLWRDPQRPDVVWKREDLGPTGSFKDRGAAVLIGLAASVGARNLIVDSSGSAALAAASACARHGLALTVHTPEGLSTGKRDALECLGATLVAEGTREAASQRARDAAHRVFYASHVYHPAFHAGTAEAAGEALDQLGSEVPALWVLPVGNGSLLLGVAAALHRGGRAGVRVVAVQAAACPGLRKPGAGGTTRASGIGIADPPRRAALLQALERMHGEVVEVSEEAIGEAVTGLGRRGVCAEPAAAAAAAGLDLLRARGETAAALVWITGSGYR